MFFSVQLSVCIATWSINSVSDEIEIITSDHAELLTEEKMTRIRLMIVQELADLSSSNTGKTERSLQFFRSNK
jgi:hypothetical protein